MNPRKARSPHLIAVLFLLAVGTAAWLGFHNASPASSRQETLGSTVKHQLPASAVAQAIAPKSPDESQPEPRQSAVPVVPEGTPVFSTPVWGPAELPPVTPASSHASQAILATATLDAKALPVLSQLKKGDKVVLPLGGGQMLQGVVSSASPNEAGRVRVAGRLNGEKGTFSMSQSVSNAQDLAGNIVQNDQHIGYKISSIGGRVKMDKQPLSAMLCDSIPVAPREAVGALLDTSPATPSAPPSGPAASLPLLDSKPGARGVLYLDFDGETVTDSNWNAGVTIFAAPANVAGVAISAAQVTDVWKRVAEDFRPFNLTVTTDPAIYAAAPVGERMHCIITPTSSWYDVPVGGITWLESYRASVADSNFTATIPCFVFNNNSTSVIALTCSHELGHALGLSHDGTAAVEYYAGNDTGATSWGPIMGAPYGKSVTQWSNGGYPGANNTEDDIQVMAATVAESGVVNGLIDDEAGANTAQAKPMPITSPVNITGTITQSTDVDWYKFTTSGGAINFTVTPSAVDPDLDTKLTLYDSTGTIMNPVSPVLATSLTSNLSRSSLAPGVYYLAVSGKGRPAVPANPNTGAPAVIGYTSYGSVGPYTITGTYFPLSAAPMITQQPAATTNANQGTKVTLSVVVLSNTTATYQWKKNNVAMPGKTASTLVFTSVQPADDATYTVDVKNAAITTPITSDPAVLNVYYKPVFTLQPTPAKTTVATGANVTYTVAANAKDSLAVINYQWKRGTAVLAGATSATLNLNNVTFFDGGVYTCVASNTIGATTSTAVTLTVTSAPIITVDLPATKHLALGGTGSAAVTVVGTAPFAYQWWKDGVKIPGAIKSSFAFAAVKTTAAGDYQVVVTNQGGAGTASSAHMIVDVQNKPAIATAGQPVAATTISSGASFTLNCTATGDPTLLYQWQFNGVNLVDGGAVSGSTTGSLTINPAAFSNQGTYRCIVTNAVGSVTSRNAVVTVLSPAAIVTPPLPLKIATGGTGVLKVVAAGTPVLKYQWIKDGIALGTAKAASLTLSRASVSLTAGSYTVTVSNAQSPGGIGVTSAPVAVMVQDAPKFVAPLLAAKTQAGLGKDVHLAVNVANGTVADPITYQWQKNNVNLAGETNATLDLLAVTNAAAGSYRCIAKNAFGTITSTATVLTVITPPTITVQPIDIVAYASTTVSFSVSATGTPTLTYQWYKDVGGGVFAPITGATLSTYKLTNVQMALDGTHYRVVVTNGTGAAGAATSNTVTLTVKPVPAPVIDDFTPHLARITEIIGGSYQPTQIILAGQNLNFTTKVHFDRVTAPLTKINATYVMNGHNELVINVPAITTGLVATSAVNDVVITVENGSGAVSTTAKFRPLDKNYTANGANPPPSDKIINASTLLRPGQGVLDYTAAPATDNTLATLESGESGFDGKSVWYHWRPSTSGQYEMDTVGSDYDTVMYFYTGPNVPTNGIADLNFVAFDDDGAAAFGDSKLTLTVAKGADYYIKIDGFGPTRLNQVSYFGPTGWEVSRVFGAQKVDAESSDSTDLASSVGGASGSGTASVNWLPTAPSPPGSIVTAKADLSIYTTIGSPEMFSWSVSDRDGTPMFSLTFDANTGEVLSQVNGGEAQATGQVFFPESVYQLSLEADFSRGVWGASLNGVQIISDQPLPESAIASGFGDVAAVWTPAAGASTSGKMHYGNFSVLAAKPEGAQ